MSGRWIVLIATRRAGTEEVIAMEAAYIYTDDPTFLAELSAAVKKLVTKLDAPLLRNILVSYYATTQRSVVNAAPKAIMHFMVGGTKDQIYQLLFENVTRGATAGLLDESPDIEAKRKGDLEVLSKLRAAKQALETLS